jgi:hypothetical protein
MIDSPDFVIWTACLGACSIAPSLHRVSRTHIRSLEVTPVLKASGSRVDIAIAVVTFAVAGVTGFVGQRLPRAKPENSIARVFSALSSKNLDSVRAETVPATYDEFLRTFGEQKFVRIQRAYDVAYNLGEPRWLELRDRARNLAAQDYDQLRLKVVGLGKDAFGALPVDARIKLMDDQDLYNEFLYEHGVSALSPPDRARIGSATEFRLGQDRDQFLDREGFAALSADDKSIAGSAAAIADGRTAENMALHDKFGIPLLSADLRDEIGAITRAEMRDPLGFKLKYGEPLARRFLRDNTIPPISNPESCDYPWQSERGSLIRGTEAVCKLSIPIPGGVQTASIFLTKRGFAWRDTLMVPSLTQISW